jgi:hypothetical protein
MDGLTRSERWAFILFFVGAALAFLAWGFPNVNRFFTVPGAIGCLSAAVFLGWPDLMRLSRQVFARERIHLVIGLVVLVALVGGIDVAYSFRPIPVEKLAETPQPAPEPAPQAPVLSDGTRSVVECLLPRQRGAPGSDLKPLAEERTTIEAVYGVSITVSSAPEVYALQWVPVRPQALGDDIKSVRIEQRRWDDRRVMFTIEYFPGSQFTKFLLIKQFQSNPSIATNRVGLVETLFGISSGICHSL